MWHENIRNRTFGFELEFADADKLLLSLPAGYKWTDNKLTMMNNSDGSAVTAEKSTPARIITPKKTLPNCATSFNRSETPAAT